MSDRGCRFPIGSLGEVCHMQPEAHTPDDVAKWPELPPHAYQPPDTGAVGEREELRAALRRASDLIRKSGRPSTPAYRDGWLDALEEVANDPAFTAAPPPDPLDVERLARAVHNSYCSCDHPESFASGHDRVAVIVAEYIRLSPVARTEAEDR